MIPDEVFAQFRTTGNRTNYEDSCFARRCQFACLVMAEVMECKGTFLPDICRGLHYFIEKEPWWGLPAHYPKAKPDSTIQPVDLFNAEIHNHNDVGSFMLCRNGEPVVIDLGCDTYTSQTFGPQRYEMTNNRSLYHNVPVVNGYEQKDGRQYEGINVDHTYTDSASIMLVDIAKAYSKEAGVKSWVRRLTLDRHFNRVEITEHIIMKDNQGSNSTDITLMCYGSPRSVQKGRVGGCRWQIKNYLFFLNSEGATPYSSLKHFEK